MKKYRIHKGQYPQAGAMVIQMIENRAIAIANGDEPGIDTSILPEKQRIQMQPVIDSFYWAIGILEEHNPAKGDIRKDVK